MKHIRKSVRRAILAIALPGLLFLLALLPPFLMRNQTRRFIGKAEISPVVIPCIGEKPATVQNGDFWERLFTGGGESVVMVKSKEEDNADDPVAEAVLQETEAQIAELIRLSALPELSLKERTEASVTEEICIETEQNAAAGGRLSIHLWSIEAEYPDFELRAYADCESKLLIEIWIHSKTEPILYPSEVAADGFLQMLKERAGEPENAEITAASNYGEYDMELFLSSKDPEGRERIRRFLDKKENDVRQYKMVIVGKEDE